MMFFRLLLISTVVVGTNSALRAAPIQAGVARIDMTPPLSLNAPLGGYGERMNKPAKGVHDRVFAKALYLTDGTRKFILLTADMVGFPPTFKPEIVKELADPQFTLDNIVMLPSHSHTSFEMNAYHPANNYKIPQIGIYSTDVHKFLIEKFTSVIRSATKNPVPVRVGTSSQSIPGWNRNRRQQGGLTDDDFTLTRIDTLEGKPLAVLVNFTAHPTFLGAEQMEFSGDWPGQLQRSLESLIGQQTTVMYYNGSEGDQAPIARPDSGPSPWERLSRYGEELAVVAWKVFTTTETKTDIPFQFHRQEIELPPKSWHPKFMETGGAEYGLTEVVLKEMLPRMFPNTTASISLRLGDLLIVGVPGEMSVELGRKVKQESSRLTGASFPTIGGLADEWDSYILTAGEYRAGGYEASVSFYGDTLGETIVAGAIKGVSQLAMSKTKKNDQPSSSNELQGKKLSVAVFQMRSEKNLTENTRRIQQFISDAAAKGARVAVFPECALSGYFDLPYMQSLTQESLMEAERQVAESCRQHNIYAVIGVPTREGDKLYNSALVIDPAGKKLERYHKIQLAEKWCVEGDHLSVFPIDGIPCSIIVCHDERYPELVRLPVLAGARVVFYVSHESGVRSESKIAPYRAQIQARAVENSVFVVHANAPANLDTTGSHGQSRVISPDGNIVVEASIFDEEPLYSTLDLKLATGRLATQSITRGPLGPWFKEAVQRVRMIAP